MEPSPALAASFRPFTEKVKAHVDAALNDWLETRIRRANAYHEEVAAHATAIFDLAIRGGKRLRPALCAASYLAFGGMGGFERIGPALVSLELLQVYLLVHDDWMDGDAVRRGGPSTHAALGRRFGSEHAGAVAAILAGDLAAAYSIEALGECDVDAASLSAAMRELGEMQHRVVLGQILDVRGVCRGSDEVERMHDLKTGSYTVRGPLRLGAALAGAGGGARAGLESFAAPLGIAFQLRDDLLGLFGDPARTGKPRGSDLREGKRTAVVAALAPVSDWAARLAAAPDMSDGELAALVDAVEKSGARQRVEARIEVLVRAAESALAELPVTDEGRKLLGGAVMTLTRREH
jgi:geranylgeranyl diphosphate synthase, type I